MQGQDQAIHLVHQLLGVRVRFQVARGDRLLDTAQQRALPGPHHGHQGLADGTGTVVILDGAADVDAAGSDFHADPLDPARKHRLQALDTAWFFHAGEKDFLLETIVVKLQHFHLQVFARAKVGKHARLAHVHFVRKQPNGQAFQAVAAGQVQRHVEDGCTGQFALAHEFD